jgi:hypothetical protein
MIRIAISQAAFEAIAQLDAHGVSGYENKTNERGERLDHGEFGRSNFAECGHVGPDGNGHRRGLSQRARLHDY